MITSYSSCKNSITRIMEILRETKGNFSNAQIAQLNDMAYKGIQSKKIKGKLDQRAVANKSVYQKLDNEVKDLVQTLDFQLLRQNYSQIINDIGECYLSCNDVIEGMQAEDCMCIALDIGRTEEAIVDPSKLVIKDVIPTFLSCESFLQSALHKLNINKDAHGGFEVDEQGDLAMGLGREKITGVLPLYLFNAHWEVAKRKSAPLFGYMCSLDIMGFKED